jgi:hypothetical protein
MDLFSTSKPSAFIQPAEHVLEKLKEENERLRKLAAALKEEVDALGGNPASFTAGMRRVSNSAADRRPASSTNRHRQSLGRPMPPLIDGPIDKEVKRYGGH